MKILFLDCGMGAAGDMLMSALLALLPEESAQEGFIRDMNNIGIPGVELVRKEDKKCGIRGLHVSVKIHGQEEAVTPKEQDVQGHSHSGPHHLHDAREGQHGYSHAHAHSHSHSHAGDGKRVQPVSTHSHSHSHSHAHVTMGEIADIIQGLAVSEQVKKQVLEIYQIIAQAESEVHGMPVTEVHFHEVGMMDALADITGCAVLIERLGADRVLASPVRVGFGQVHCAHGILPVPAPAAALLLRGIPCYAGDIEGELCTPTGAALLRYYVREFRAMPPMRIQAVGYGSGKKDLPAANVVRALLGEIEEDSSQILELSCNLDDMTGEEIGYAMEKLRDLGALEVFTVPVGMKKSRPGVLLSVFCPVEEKEKFAVCLFRHTSTIGIREQIWDRLKMHRRERIFESSIGKVRVKVSSGFGVEKEKVEYEDLREIAQVQGMPLGEVRDIVLDEIRSGGRTNA